MHCTFLFLLPLCVGNCVGSMFRGEVLGAFSIVLLKEERDCCFSLIVLWLSGFVVSSLWCHGLVCSLIVSFPGHTHLYL